MYHQKASDKTMNSFTKKNQYIYQYIFKMLRIKFSYQYIMNMYLNKYWGNQQGNKAGSKRLHDTEKSVKARRMINKIDKFNKNMTYTLR